MKNNYQWKSDIADYIQAFLNEKRMTGYKFEFQENCLKKFDLYYADNGYTGVRITKPMAHGYIYCPDERPSTWYVKERILRDFGLFLIRHGWNEIYIPEILSAPKKCAFEPYIFTDEEVGRLFTVIDNWEDSHLTNRHLVDPIFFRLLYSIGVRLSEALHLMVKDFDSTNGILMIYQAKNSKDRLVPLHFNMTHRIIEYSKCMHRYSKETDYLFPSAFGNDRCTDQSTIRRRFRQYLFRAGIDLKGTGPRIHDFRHSFAVKCLKKWVLEGGELTNLLPYLAAYMGHSDFRGTQYYLRLTADMHPDIINRTEADFGYVIPEGGVDIEGI